LAEVRGPVLYFLDMIDHEQIELAGPSASVFSSAWRLQSADSGVRHEVVSPDGCCELIVHLGQSPWEMLDGQWTQQPRAFLYGPLTRVLELKMDGPMDVRALRLHPHGIGWLSSDPFALRDRAVVLDDLFGSAAPIARAASESDSLETFATSALAALRPFHASPPGLTRVRKASALLQREPWADASRLSAAAACSDRTLTRAFKRVCGLTPSEYVRIQRFQNARRAIKGGTSDLSDVAAMAGYTDQAHMTRSFRKLTGLTPRAIKAELTFDPLYEERPDIESES